MKIKILPSLLAADFGWLERDALKAQESGADELHLDIMDGHFVPNISFGPVVIRSLRPLTSLMFETHLMISEPEKYIGDFCKAGSDLVIVHTESTPHVHRAIQQIHGNGKLAGATINPATPLTALEELFHEVDLILLMSVNPGFGNQKFIPNALKRIERLAKIKRTHGYQFEIEADGGINTKTIASACRAGADVLVAVSAIFNSPAGIPAAMEALKTAAGK